MLRFFRTLRQRLLSESRFSKYLLYAMGEIALVMIGILLALQVNNWNEARKARSKEIKIYREILADLGVTLEEVRRDMASHRTILGNTQYLIGHIIAQKPYTDSIISALINTTVDLQVYPKSSGFEALNSIGLDLLSNDSVRIRITDLYQLSLKRLVELGARETPSQDLGNLVMPLIEKHFEVDKDPAHMRADFIGPDSVRAFLPKLRNYDAFLQDGELLRSLNYSLIRRGQKIRRHFATVSDLQAAMTAIENELNRIQ